MRHPLSAVFACLLTCTATNAQVVPLEQLPMPKAVGELLPVPMPIVEMGPLGPVLPGYSHPDPNAHWQNLALDKQGFPKPRVVLAPQPYYLYNGQPYYFYRARPQDYTTNPFGRR